MTMPSTQIVLQQEGGTSTFLLKLWRLVEDPSYQHCIKWDDSGFSFHILDPQTFSKEVLPLFFKHNNINSFIRQLNMYGFHKVASVERGGLLTSDRDDIQFQHDFFVRNHPELLPYIQRKMTGVAPVNSLATPELTTKSKSPALGSLLAEVKALREKQSQVDAKLSEMKRENDALWHDLSEMRKMHTQQQQIVTKLLQFLINVVQIGRNNQRVASKRPYLMIDSINSNDLMSLASSNNVKIVPSGMAAVPASSKRPRLQPTVIKNVPSVVSDHDYLSNSPNNPLLGGPVISDVTEEYDLAEAQGRAPQQMLGQTPWIDEIGSSVPVNAGEGPASAAEQSAALLRDLLAASPSQSGPVLVDTTSIHDYDPMLSNVRVPTPPNNVAGPSSTMPLNGGSTLSQLPQSQNDMNLPLDDTFDKTNFSDYLDYAQADLDYVRDLLDAGDLQLDEEAINSLFDLANEQNTAVEPNKPLRQQPMSDATDRRFYNSDDQLQVYQTPKPLTDIESWNAVPVASATLSTPAVTLSDTSLPPTTDVLLEAASVIFSPLTVANSVSNFNNVNLDTPVVKLTPPTFPATTSSKRLKK